jgi:predicted nucleic acid-binding protein
VSRAIYAQQAPRNGGCPWQPGSDRTLQPTQLELAHSGDGLEVVVETQQHGAVLQDHSCQQQIEAGHRAPGGATGLSQGRGPLPQVRWCGETGPAGAGRGRAAAGQQRNPYGAVIRSRHHAHHRGSAGGGAESARCPVPPKGHLPGPGAAGSPEPVAGAAAAPAWGDVRPVARAPRDVARPAGGPAPGLGRPLMLLLDTNLLIDVLRGETVALLEPWLDAFPRLNLDQAIARESVLLRQRHGLNVPDAIILATARCAELTLATRSVRDFPLELGGVLHPYSL